MSTFDAIMQNVATVELLRQQVPVRVVNTGTRIAIILHPGVRPILYWELVPGEHFDITHSFPHRLLIAGDVELEPIEP